MSCDLSVQINLEPMADMVAEAVSLVEGGDADYSWLDEILALGSDHLMDYVRTPGGFELRPSAEFEALVALMRREVQGAA